MIFSEGTIVKKSFLMTKCHHSIEVLSPFDADDKLTSALEEIDIVPVENQEVIYW